jgi:hypothetical protein
MTRLLTTLQSATTRREQGLRAAPQGTATAVQGRGSTELLRAKFKACRAARIAFPLRKEE